MKFYENPQLEFLALYTENFLTASGEGEGEGDDEEKEDSYFPVDGGVL